MEDIDFQEPHSDIHDLFNYYNKLYFGGCLVTTTVEYSSARMTSCAGTCEYLPGGGNKIKLSEPLLKFRPAIDLKETLLHEGGHGPPFQRKMEEINRSTVPDYQRPVQGYHISQCHSFIQEVNLYKTHHWKCELLRQVWHSKLGVKKKTDASKELIERKEKYHPLHSQRCGHLVKRANNRPPQDADCRTGKEAAKPCPLPYCYFCKHLRECGHNPPAAYTKIAKPEDYGKKKKRKTFADGTPLPAKRPRKKAVTTPQGTPKGKPSNAVDIADFFVRKGQARLEGSPALPANASPEGRARAERELRAAAAERRLQSQAQAQERGEGGGQGGPSSSPYQGEEGSGTELDTESDGEGEPGARACAGEARQPPRRNLIKALDPSGGREVLAGEGGHGRASQERQPLSAADKGKGKLREAGPAPQAEQEVICLSSDSEPEAAPRQLCDPEDPSIGSSRGQGLVQCPICLQSLPAALIEDHVLLHCLD